MTTITFPDADSRVAFLKQFDAMGKLRSIGIRLNLDSAPRPELKGYYDPRNAFVLERTDADYRMTPDLLATALGSLVLNKGLMSPTEQARVVAKVRTQFRVQRGSAPGSNTDLVCSPDTALTLRVHRLVLAATTPGERSPLLKLGFTLRQLLAAAPEHMDRSWNSPPRKPWVRLRQQRGGQPRAPAESEGVIPPTAPRIPKVIIIEKQAAAAAEESPAVASAHGRRVEWVSVAVSPPLIPHPSPSSAAASPLAGSSDGSIITESPLSPASFKGVGHSPESSRGVTPVPPSDKLDDIYSLLRSKPRKPAGTRALDLDVLAFGVVKIVQQHWPTDTGPPGCTSGTDSGGGSSFLRFLRQLMEFFSE